MTSVRNTTLTHTHNRKRTGGRRRSTAKDDEADARRRQQRRLRGRLPTPLSFQSLLAALFLSRRSLLSPDHSLSVSSEDSPGSSPVACNQNGKGRRRVRLQPSPMALFNSTFPHFTILTQHSHSFQNNLYQHIILRDHTVHIQGISPIIHILSRSLALIYHAIHIITY